MGSLPALGTSPCHWCGQKKSSTACCRILMAPGYCVGQVPYLETQAYLGVWPWHTDSFWPLQVISPATQKDFFFFFFLNSRIQSQGSISIYMRIQGSICPNLPCRQLFYTAIQDFCYQCFQWQRKRKGGMQQPPHPPQFKRCISVISGKKKYMDKRRAAKRARAMHTALPTSRAPCGQKGSSPFSSAFPPPTNS